MMPLGDVEKFIPVEIRTGKIGESMNKKFDDDEDDGYDPKPGIGSAFGIGGRTCIGNGGFHTHGPVGWGEIVQGY